VYVLSLLLLVFFFLYQKPSSLLVIYVDMKEYFRTVNLSNLQANVLSELTYFQALKYQDALRELFRDETDLH
jgi:hypothetical protein